MELKDCIEYWTGLEPADMKLFNVREKNRYVQMLVKDKVFQQFQYVDLHTGLVSHWVYWGFKIP